MSKKLDLKDKVFTYLTVLYENGRKNKKVVWRCRCKCGNEVDVISTDLTFWKTKSCGCRKLEKQTHHNMHKTKFYSVWRHMKQRCTNIRKHNYKWYGGRGIKYDSTWEEFENFRDDLYESYLDHVKEYGEHNTSLDRIDVNGNYCKENCRWATLYEQSNNKRVNHYVEIDGEMLSIRQVCDRYNMKYPTVILRVNDGLDIFGNRLVEKKARKLMVKLQTGVLIPLADYCRGKDLRYGTIYSRITKDKNYLGLEVIEL